jgi:DNA mismatch repair protein MutS
LAKLKNVHVGAVEEHGNLVFLHKMMPGPADKSYGIHVAKLAGLPSDLLNRADAILKQLEAATPEKTVPAAPSQVTDQQLSLFEEPKPQPKNSPILAKLAKFDLMDATPMDAMNLIFDLQKRLKKK